MATKEKPSFATETNPDIHRGSRKSPLTLNNFKKYMFVFPKIGVKKGDINIYIAFFYTNFNYPFQHSQYFTR
jgi:hypothetical protein